jgi:two-component system, NarL family, sensor histidine kinase UhpB
MVFSSIIQISEAKILLLVFLALNWVPSSAQRITEIDSMINLVKSLSPDTNKVKTLNILSFSLSQKSRDHESLVYSKEALAIAERLNYKTGIATAHRRLGVAYDALGDYKDALKSHLASLKINREIENAQGTAIQYNNIGLVNWHLGNYADALQNYFYALRINEQIGNKGRVGANHNNIGIIYDLQGDYPEALKHYKSALKIGVELENKFDMATAYINIGINCRYQGNYPDALKYEHLALKMWEELGNKDGMVSSYSEMAEVYHLQGNYPEALKYYQVALKIAEEIAIKGGIAFMNIRIGEIYIELNNHVEAKKYIMEGLNVSKAIGHKDNLMTAYRNLSKLDSAMGNPFQALLNYKLYTKYKDSLFNESSNQQIAELKEQYDSEKKDKEILLLASDKEKLETEKQISALEREKILALNLFNRKQIELLGNEKKLQLLQIGKNHADYTAQKAEADRKQEQLNKEKAIQTLEARKQKQAKNYLIAGLILFAALSFIIYRNYHTRQQLKLLTLRNKIAIDLHDDVGSTLSSISMFSQVAQEQSKEVIPALEIIGESSRRMLDAMADIVWTINPENDQFEKIILRMRSFAYELLGAKKIDFRFTAPEGISNIRLSMEARRNLYLIFKESINNMVKYSDADKAMFTLQGEKDKLTMMIWDNGKGFDASMASQGNGLNNMKKRAGDMGGDLFIESHPGAGTTIRLQLAI